MKQDICSLFTTQLFKLVVAALVLFFPVAYSLAAPCDLKSSPPAFIRHDLTGTPSVSYCELCGYGYVTIVVSNTYTGTVPDVTDMINMTVVEDLRTSGLTFEPGAPNPIRYSINGGALQVGGAPVISGANGSVLTWTSAQIPDLALLVPLPGINSFSTLAITFAVKRDAGLSQEALITASRDIQASLDYSTSPVCIVTSPVLTSVDTLPLREPVPSMIKLGRNVDANQGAGNYTATVYGNINDDVIWRIQVDNAGLAGLQDMVFNDVMLPGNITTNYACPSEASATAVAANNGVDPGGLGCVLSSNTITDFIVSNPFGTPNNDVPDNVDVPASSFTQIYLVGKISSSCFATTTTNTASNLRWGCAIDAPAGGITTTSTGITPVSSVATLSTLVGLPPAGLNVTRQLRGTNTAQPAGSKGTMTITITNNTGGSIKNIKLRDVLPVEYVMDSTFTPTVVASGGYGNYDGRTDRITWTNPVANTFPLTSVTPAEPLANTQPEFTLSSSTVHPVYADQLNMLRAGETLTIDFRVVLIRPLSYDKVANLDVTPEITGDGTDPTHVTTLSTNSLYLTYEDFCNVGTLNAPTYPYNDNFTASPEDLDIAINGAVFILTNTQTLTLPLVLTNNGGHEARDHHVFVSFGATMEVTFAPAGCNLIAHATAPTYQPLPWRVWTLPAPIPGSAAVYECLPGGALSNPLPPGASDTLSFQVVKTTDAARLAIDDLSFRADVVGEVTLTGYPSGSPTPIPLWFPAPTARTDAQTDRANNYSLDGVRARVIGFNLTKNRLGNCSENPSVNDSFVQIGEECTFNIDTGGWFGFLTPGFTYIAVQNITVTDELPNGQGYISNNVPVPAPPNTPQINNIAITQQVAQPLATLNEAWIDWKFNPVPALWPSGVAHPNRITQKDEWFYANVVTRTLNDPLVSGVPNFHLATSTNVLNSTFEAVFNNASTGLDEIYLLGHLPGSDTIGYPLAAPRTVNLTVTEPRITVTKRVCNETLYGVGTGCSNFVALANNGDTYDNYIYRITLTNAASPRAPAYDVTATDVLDASDLAYIVPFANDGLDNDGDGLIDALDLDGESSISDNIVKNGTPATITISHTHSNALLKINPGTSVTFYYRVDPDQDVQPGQILTNSVTTTYDSLAGASGAQTVVQPANNTIGGARIYSTAATTARVQMITPLTQPKKIVQLSQLNHAVPVTPPTAQPVSVGEEIKYELHTYLPIANLRNFVITDNLPAGLRCIEAPSVNLSAAPYSAAGFVPGGTITPTCTDSQVIWNFGNQVLTNGAGITYYDFSINFIGRIENTANTNSGGLIRNGGAFSVANAQYTNSSNVVVTLPYANADVQVQEPVITLTKVFSQTNPDASDVLTVTVTATNANTADTATAYNLRVMDDLAAAVQLTYLGNVGGLDPPDVVDLSTPNRPIFSWNSANPSYSIAKNTSRSFTYQVRVIDSVAQPLEPLEVISNSTINRMYAKWDSLPGSSTRLNTLGPLGADGSATGLRNGVLPNAGIQPNDYETTTFSTLTVPQASVSKSDLSAAVVPAIGAYKNFQIDINLPEGTTQNILVTDNLAVGTLSYLLSNNATNDITYTFDGIASINGVAPSEAAFTAFPADNTTGSAVWNIGKVITTTENDPTFTAISPRIRINYWARIDNLTTADVGDTLRNSVLVNYRNGNTGATEALTSSPALVTVVEPNLTLSKAAGNITSPGVLPDGGDILEYTLTLTNTGNSTAYDINLVDTLPALLNYYASFTPTATIGGVAVAGFVPVPAGTPGGPLKWGRDNADGSLDLPASQTLTLTYRVIVMPTAEPNTVLSNNVYADWTSLNGVSSFERTGAGCPSIVAPNDHCVGPAVATTTIIDKNSITKSVVSDSYVVASLSTAGDSTVRVGDTVTYQLSVNIQEGRSRNVVVSDVLPTGMAFDGMVSINGDISSPFTPPGAGAYSNFSYTLTSNPTVGQTGTLTWNFGTITNNALGDPTTDTLVIVFRAKVMPNAGIPQLPSTTTLTNTSTLTYLDGNSATPVAPARLVSSAPITVVQPVIATLTKTEATHISGALVNATPTGDIMNFRLSACNSGAAPAYGVVLIDTLAAEFDNASIRALSSALKLQPDVTINGTLAVPATDYVYTAPPADAGSFTISLNQAVNPGQCVYVDFYIGFDMVAPIHAWNNTVNLSPYWSLPPATAQQYAGLGPVNFGMNNVATLPILTKTLLPIASAGEVTIGDEFTYRITLPGSSVPGTLFDTILTDALNSSLVFVSASKTVGGITSSVANSGTPSNVILNLGNVNNQAVIDMIVRVNNSALANAGNLIDNTATYTYAVTSGGVAINGGIVTTAVSERKTIVEPLVTMSKAVVNTTPPGGAPSAGDVLRYTLTMIATSGANFTNAYDISILDTLGLGLLYQGNPTVDGGNTIVAPQVVSGNGISAPQVLNWSLANGSNIDIAEGSTVHVTYDVVVLDSVLANQALSNSAIVQWTSLNGSNANERTGTNTPTYNDYFTAPATVTQTTLSPVISKTLVNTTYGPGSVVRIGDVVEFRLRLSLPEGTTAATVVSDVLPRGLQFEGVVSINGDTSASYTSVAPFTHASIAGATVTGDPLLGPSTVSWNIGSIVNTGDNNVANDNFDIIYRARVLNNVLAQGTGATQTLTNTATLNYTSAAGAASTSASASLTVQQPLLTVSKTSSPVTGSTIAAGATVTYTVVISNSGTAPAYDVQLRDVIPAGMRVGGITMVSPAVVPAYSSATGIATWNLNPAGVPNAYTIAAGGTLTLIYTVQADAGLSAGMTMTNLAQVQSYCSFDDEAVPVLGVTGVRQCYGVSPVASTTLYSAAVSPLTKLNLQASAAMGQQFSYRITIPATPQVTSLYDVRILDNLAASVADMSYVSITQVAGPVVWTPVVTGTPKNLVISGSGTGIDILAGQQLVFEVNVVLNDNIAVNTSGLTFLNSATYTFNQFNGDNATQVTSVVPGTASMTIVGPDTVTMQKSGPATMRVGTPGTFTLDVQNTGSGTAWDMTIVDILPNPAPGGMCDVAPTAIAVQANGVPLTLVTDYTSSFAAAPVCTLTLTMTSAAAAITPGNHLIVTYQASLDADNYTGATLTNIAGATQWFSANTVANVATSPASSADGEIHTYSHAITDGTPVTLDQQAAHSLITESPDLEFRKTVFNVTTGGSGAAARPGDLLRYTITLNNVSTLPISNFTLTDELDRLNATAMFLPGSLVLISVSNSTYTNASNATGGSKGTGLLDIRNLSIDAQGGPNANLTFVFEARLAAVITNYTAVLNQAQLPTISNPPLNSDDLINGTFTSTIGDEVPTPTVITSAPIFQVRKTSLDITGDPLVLLAGERLRYTITVKNIGNENASGVTLRDSLPANTTYVLGSTRLNGVAVPDISGASPLQSGMLINAPENLTTGVMRADATATITNIATITFEVQVNANALNGTIIANQGFVNGSGLGSGVFPEKPSDDPATTSIPDDPTLNIVGNYPLLRAQKTVAIRAPDGGTAGLVDPLDYLRYTITINNLAAIPATGVMFTDLVPVNTTYVAGSTTLNTLAVPDSGVSPLIPPGIAVNSPASATGVIAAHASAVVTFDVRVNAGVVAGTVITNQGNVTSIELPSEPTDADGNSSNGYQPTTIIVGSAQQVLITKQVSVVGGGAALPGGQLEYIVRVTNTGTVTANSVTLSDDLTALAALATYVPGSGTLNGLTAPVVVVGQVITAAYGDLLPGASVQLRFRVLIAAGLPMGTTITNIGQVTWNAPLLNASASVSIDVGGIPGSGNLNGHLWHDTNFNNLSDTGEPNLAGWTVGVYRNNVMLGSTSSDVSTGQYSINGLTPTTTIADQYTLRFSAPGAVATTAKLGLADSIYTNGMQQISGITVLSGSNQQNLNLPIDPNGALYNSILRTPVTGAALTLVRAGSTVALPANCFDDPAQQGQVTLPSGFYKFDLNFSDPSCPSGGDYLIQLTSPLAYLPGQSLIIPPLNDATTAAFSVPSCPLSAADAIPATGTYCESQTSAYAPPLAVPVNTIGTNYYLRLALSNPVPGSSQIFNNHIPVDPRLDNAVSITKVASLQNVTKGQLIPYTITVNNTMSVTLTNLAIVDSFPPGFKYVAHSGRVDGLPVEPVSTARQLSWNNLQLATNTKRVIQLMLIVGSGVKEGKYVNRAQVFNTVTGGAASPEASATVRVIPDPTLDCSDVIGKVFDDANLNGYQDEGEMGLPGVRVVTAKGLIVTADKFGRFHVTCAVVPDPDRGSNFILKVDDRTLPSGYRMTTENPRVERATRGKMLKFNFGAAIHKVVKLDMADGVFEPGATEMRVQWKQRIDLLMGELKKSASVLRLSYLAETEKESLVNERLKIVKREIARMWKLQKGNYDLAIETEVFWSRGSPPEKNVIND